MRVWLASMIALLGLPMASAAAELNSGVGSEGYWTDNVYSQSVDEVDDLSVRVSPWGEVADSDGDVTWGLRYGPSYEYYLEEDDVSGFDHDAEARVAWKVTPATTLRLADHFQFYHSLSRFNDQQATGQDIVVVGRRVEYQTNLVNGSLEHFFDPRNVFSMNLYYTTQSFSERGQLDRTFYGSSALYRHIWSERTTIGATASWSRQSIEQIDLPDRETDYLNVSALYQYAFSRSLHLEVSAGPALVLSDADDISLPASVSRAIYPVFTISGASHYVDADTCPRNGAGERLLTLECGVVQPAFGPGQGPGAGNVADFAVIGGPSPDDSTSTYFADVSLVKDWERVRGELSYQRREDQSTGFGAVSDIFYGSLRWQIGRRLSAKVITSYEIRESATESVALVNVVANEPSPAPAFPQVARTQGVNAELVGSDFGLDVVIASLQLSYDLSHRSAVYTTILYRDEQSNGDVILERDMQRFGIAVGIRYVFDSFDLDSFDFGSFDL